MRDNRKLAKYLRKEIKTHYDVIPTVDELEFWIQQFKLRKWEGHTEWNETYKTNVWIRDNEEE